MIRCENAMDKQEYRQSAYLMIKLIAYFLNHDPDLSKIMVDNEDTLYLVSKHHRLSVLTAAALLQKQGYISENFKIAHAKGQQKSILFKREMQLIGDELDKRQIAYMPLKGMQLAELYPTVGSREMTDIDILIGSDAFEQIKTMMLDNKYQVKFFGKYNHDVYLKPPFFVVEIHRTLFDRKRFPEIQSYFDAQKYSAEAEQPNHLHMTAAQTYIYLVTHAYIHYSTAGTGLRTLFDIFLYLKRYEHELDFSLISSELEKMSISDFEKKLRDLSQVFFSPDLLSSEDRKELDRYIFAGVHGNRSYLYKYSFLEYSAKKSSNSKLRYILHRLAPPDDPAEDHRVLRPLHVVARPIKAIFTKPKTILQELKILKNTSQDE